MIDINTLADADFAKLPLVIEGESKEIRYAGKGCVVIRFKPTIYSFTANRTGVVPGSDALRLRASKMFARVLKDAGIKHAYREVNDRWALADLLLHPATTVDAKPFRPQDLTAEEMARLAIAPPIETVIKRMHSGTSKHRYFGMAGQPVRSNHPLYSGMTFANEDAYPQTIVRFDWRNPFTDGKGKQLADEVLGDMQADWFIDTEKARLTALKVYDALSDFLNERDIVCYDLCLFIAEDGEAVFGEISQDCGRYRHFDLGSLDKDVWRSGGSHGDVLAKWTLLLDMIEQKGQ
jgi:phosphoribosylaminoimidazole-succinocarboxamide synthase